MAERSELVYEAGDEPDLARAKAFLSSAGIPFWVQGLTSLWRGLGGTSAGAWGAAGVGLHGGVYARIHVPEKHAQRAREVLEAMVSGEIVAEDLSAGEDEPPPDEGRE